MKIAGSIALAAVLTSVTFASGCIGASPIVTGSGKLISWDFDHRDFRKIEAGSAFELNIAKSDSYLVQVTFDENLLEYLDVEKSGDILRIRLKPNYNYINCAHTANITLPDLRELGLWGDSHAEVKGFHTSRSVRFELSGASSAHIEDFVSGSMHFEISGGSNATGNIKIENGLLVLSGGSEIELTGTAGDISVKASGASLVRLDDFIVSSAGVNLSGASEATINTTGRLDVNMSGASRLYTIGKPKLGEFSASGGSTIIPK